MVVPLLSFLDAHAGSLLDAHAGSSLLDAALVHLDAGGVLLLDERAIANIERPFYDAIIYTVQCAGLLTRYIVLWLTV